MARIEPLITKEISPSVKDAFERHVQEYGGRITNMKATLGHSLIAFEAYMQWYPLYAEVEKILGKRMASLYAHSISCAADCPLCSTFFRKIIIDSGETPEKLRLTESEKMFWILAAALQSIKEILPIIFIMQSQLNIMKTEMVILTAFRGT